MILQRAKDLDCYWVFSVQADNTPAPEALQKMVDLALYGNVHLVTHACPMHKVAAEAAGIPENSFYYHELGCCLMTRTLLERALDEFEEYGRWCPQSGGRATATMAATSSSRTPSRWGIWTAMKSSFNNLAPSEIAGLIFPGAMPQNVGTELPSVLREG